MPSQIGDIRLALMAMWERLAGSQPASERSVIRGQLSDWTPITYYLLA